MAVETLPFLSAVERMVRAAGRRVAEADEFELAELIHLRDVIDEAIQTAVDGQIGVGRSWSDIAVATGKSRQAAFKRWGRKGQAA